MKRFIFAAILLLQANFSVASSEGVSEILRQAHAIKFTDCDSAISEYYKQLFYNKIDEDLKQVAVKNKVLVEEEFFNSKSKYYALPDPEIQIVIGKASNEGLVVFHEVGIQKTGGYCIFRPSAGIVSFVSNPGDCYNSPFGRLLAKVGRYHWFSDHSVCTESGNDLQSIPFLNGTRVKQFPTDSSRKLK